MRSNAISLATAAALIAFVLSGCASDRETPPTAAAPAKPAPKRESALPSAAESRTATARLARKGALIYCGGRSKPWVALTFDDGPGSYSKHVLALLHKHDVPATFFVVGENVKQRSRTVGRERNRGAAIGNHSWSHPVLPSLSGRAQRAQLMNTNRQITRVTGERVRLFRPPYMERDDVTDRVTKRLGLATILWNVDSRDSLGANSKEIARRVKRGLHPGAIILLHENHGQTVRALRYSIFRSLRRSGMTPVTVPQMLAGNPPTKRQLKLGRRGCRK